MSLIPVVACTSLGPVITTGIATAISMFWISAAAALDMMCRQLPDALVVLAFVPTAMAAAVLTLQGSTTAINGVGIGAAAWLLPLLAVHLIAPDGLGFGDVKAAGVIGAILGLTQHLTLVVAGLVTAVVVAAVPARRSTRRDIALGPYLVSGAVACLAIGSLTREIS
jgi:leader peptidase (prepilin peptidase)/N-methyltransferase